MLLILSVGMTYVMIAGGFDLSIGSVLVFSGVLAAKAMEALGPTDGLLTVLIGLVVSLAAGLGWGLFNGFLHRAAARVRPDHHTRNDGAPHRGSRISLPTAATSARFRTL